MISLISKASLPVFAFIASQHQSLTIHNEDRQNSLAFSDHSTVRTTPHLAAILLIPFLKQYLWPEAIWTWVNQHIINYVSIKCILAKRSGDLQSDEPGDAAQARTAGTIKGRR